MNSNLILSLFLFLMSCSLMILYNKHLLMTLITLEFIMISLIFMMFLMQMILEMNIYIILITLVMMVCEGALSITLMILLVRLHGNDQIFSLNLIKW